MSVNARQQTRCVASHAGLKVTCSLFGRGKYFCKSEKTSGQSVRPKKIKTGSAFLSHHGRLVLKIFL